MKRFEVAVLIGIIVAVFAASVTTFASECVEVREQVVRLHILANSDSDEDQALKLAVRDAVLDGTSDIFTVSDGKEQIEQLTLQHIPEIEAIARNEIVAQGYDYDVHAELVNMYFETRVYEQATLPAGYYDAVRITIGSGDGQNWWCVMFPPMCIPAASSGEGAELEEQIARLGQQPGYQPKFAIVELAESTWNKLSGRQESPVYQQIAQAL